MDARDGTTLIGVGASAGGVEALLDLAEGLPADLPAAVFVVLHQLPTAPTVLPNLLGRRCALPVEHGRDGAVVERGRVYVAPPDHHLLVHDGRLVVSRGPKENGHRPSVDPLFRSLALEAGPSAIGVVLSGMLDDGSAGLLEMVRHGGTAVVQEPEEALFPDMPRAALHQVPGAVVRPVAALAEVFVELAARPSLGGRGASEQLVYEVAVARNDTTEVARSDPPGPPAGLSCPDCSGPLFDLSERHLLHYRCRVGHSWTEESLHVEQNGRVEDALYAALQALEEKAALQHRIAATAAARNSSRVVTRARETAHDALRAASLVRALLVEPAGRTSSTEETTTNGEVL
ncbi:two-component system chemotaxis response regulator CheB [Actinomycetospora succinea]|uniref:protein-glutamate methylesterase n=1 Tax=Actinomycetospora succinea TaxID=663603 RepID=A0A4R6UM09_9PSEU|nr:chemotaxis protein CheB [Actinomycetospora succinea]TDQ47941.1 two-component system chemotaxis response regulator CheB [Actinomycetospora succinea]